MERQQSRKEAPGYSQGERFKKSFSDRDARFNELSMEVILTQIDALCEEQTATWVRKYVNGTPVQRLANESGVPRSQVENGLKEAREKIVTAAKLTLSISSTPQVTEQARPAVVNVSPPRPVGLRTLPNEQIDYGTKWRAKAACASKDPEMFFPYDPKPTNPAVEAAKNICKRCVAIDSCLSYALENDETFGVWGGLSEEERRKLKRRNSVRRR